MNDVRAGDYWDRKGLALVVGGLLIAPLAWLFDLQASYSLVKWACQHDRRWVLFALPCVSLTAVAIGTGISGSSIARLRPQAQEDGGGRTDRTYLLALAGLTLNVFFALLILTSLVPRYVLSPCE